MLIKVLAEQTLTIAPAATADLVLIHRHDPRFFTGHPVAELVDEALIPSRSPIDIRDLRAHHLVPVSRPADDTPVVFSAIGSAYHAARCLRVVGLPL